LKKRNIALFVIMVLLCSTIFAYAASDPDITIVSPAQTVYGDNLLVSVKMAAPKTMKVSVYEEKQKVGDTLVSIDPSEVDEKKIDSSKIYSVSIMMPETYTGTGNLQFYNKQLNEISPGLYKIKVETLNAAGEVAASNSMRVVVMSKESEAATGSAIFESGQPGAFQWVQNLLKSIFGN